MIRKLVYAAIASALLCALGNAQTKVNLQTQVKGTLPTANGGLGTSLGPIDTLPLVTATGTISFESLPDCADTGGNHLNYATATHTFTCGTTSSSSGSGSITITNAST